MDAGNDEKYAPASVESFGFSIGIGLRVVLLAFTFELDAATYCVDYDGADWRPAGISSMTGYRTHRETASGGHHPPAPEHRTEALRAGGQR